MSTKKSSRTLPAARSEINTDHNDWLTDISQETCNHAWFYASHFREYPNGWQYARLHCQICGHSWDAWSIPMADNSLTLLPGFNGQRSVESMKRGDND